MSGETETYSLTTNLPTGCGCAACMNLTAEAVNFASADLDGGVIPAASAEVNHSDALQSGYRWGSGTSGMNLNFKFHTSYQSYWAQDPSSSYSTSGMTAFSTAQKTAVNQILDMIESFTNLTFTEVSGSTDPQIGFINANAASNSLGGSAYYPTGWQGAGDVFINKNFWGFSEPTTPGGVNFYVLMHEIGHTLGLQHSFEELSGAYATEQYSVMAYDMTTWGNTFASTYMLYDIAALQALYGANMNYNSGNTVYTVNGSKAFSIWDGGGIDTLDGSATGNALTLRLEAGSFSSGGALTNNITIAYGAIIENANGGGGNDTIYGNSVANVINGNGGNDTIHGDAGNDTIDGGAGTDTVVYTAAFSSFTVSQVNSSTLRLTHATFGQDTLTTVETVTFNGVAKTWAELMGGAPPTPTLATINANFAWSGGKYAWKSTTAMDGMLTSTVMKNKKGTGDLVDVERDADGLSVRVVTPGGPAIDSFTLTHTTDMDVTATGFKTVTLNMTKGTTGSHLAAIDAMAATLTGGKGADNIDLDLAEYGTTIKAAKSAITGNDGNDTIDVTGVHRAMTLTIKGGNGNDVINIGVAGKHTVSGDSGDDTINGSAGSEKITGGDGNDIINGNAGDDTIDGGNGNDTLNGGAGIEKLIGGNGNDTMNGGDGNDSVDGGNDNDILYGGANDDKVLGGNGNDVLYGDAGNDTLDGGAGDDKVWGGAGTDKVSGGAGNDIIFTGEGLDTLYGGTGNDIFVIEIDSIADKIADFKIGQDKLNLSNIIEDFDPISDAIADFVKIVKGASSFEVHVDANGGGNSFVHAVTVSGKLAANVTVASLFAQDTIVLDDPQSM